MNLKSFFGGKNEPNAPLENPRAQHYNFAHRIMPQVAHQFGANVVLLLDNSAEAPGFLLRRWNEAGQGLTGKDLVAAIGLRASIHEKNGRLAAIIGLPTPRAVTEAYFVAIVCDIPPQPPADKSDASLEVYRDGLAQIAVDYFTLEFGFSLDATRRTAFCAWTRDGAHHNMGDGPPPDETAFLEHLFAKPRP